MTPAYTIIIPHKDIPDLLQRCLDSIPVRDDIEVIVVDDNSDLRKVDFGNFPKWQGAQYEYYLTKEGKGAGYARNVGLDHAKGRWIIFADADDFFIADFNSLLNEMADAEEDIVFFDYINVLSDDIMQQVEERVQYRKYIAAYLDGNQSEFSLRVLFASPCCKIVRRELIEHHHIRFSEVQWGEDVFFSVETGFYADAIGVSGKRAYAITSRAGSVTDNFCATAREFRVRTAEVLKCDDLLAEKYGKCARSRYWFGFVCRKKRVWRFAWFTVANVFHPRVFGPAALFLARVAGTKVKSLMR